MEIKIQQVNIPSHAEIGDWAKMSIKILNLSTSLGHSRFKCTEYEEFPFLWFSCLHIVYILLAELVHISDRLNATSNEKEKNKRI